MTAVLQYNYFTRKIHEAMLKGFRLIINIFTPLNIKLYCIANWVLADIFRETTESKTIGQRLELLDTCITILITIICQQKFWLKQWES